MLTIDPTRSALLVMDFQLEILDRLGDAAAPLLERAAAAIEAARAASIPVLYVVVGFRPGYPEVSDRNAMFSMIKQSGRFTGSPDAAVHPTVKPRPDESVVVKHRVGAFHGTDLELLLRTKGVDTLLLAGFATSGVVLSTLRHAADADYRLVVLSDACGDADPEVHRVLMEKVFPRQAAVSTVSEAIAAFAQPA